ncbi:MAG: membrane dipeptidase [Chloroflexi bacterium]|nr:membrane dipeptidase [Chloroflexota bacterium]
MLPDLRAGGVDVVLATVASLEDARFAVGELAAWLDLAEGSMPFRLVRSVEEIRAAKAAGMLAVVLHFQGGNPIETDAALVDVYAQLGVRVVQLTYNFANAIGDGCLEPRGAGLTAFGCNVVERLVAQRVAVDVSHVGVRTALDAVELAGPVAPVVATHANARAVCDHPRNLPDEVVRAIAATGGVIGLCAFPAFVAGSSVATLDQLLAHADHLSELVGPEHVGLGFDFADEDEDDYVYYGYDPRWYPRPPWVFPEGIGGFAESGNVTEALRARGYSDGQIGGILGENFLRAFRAIWGA